MSAYSEISTRVTHQGEQARPEQVANNAGGYVFTVDNEARLKRFLILGTDAGTYYASAKDHTKQAAQFLIANRSPKMVDTIVEVSQAGRAPKNTPAIFALAVCAGAEDQDTRKAALTALPLVCRTGTHLFEFLGYVENFRGWGPALVKAVDRWYTERSDRSLAMQLVKYRQRNGWTHADVLKLAHKGRGKQRADLFDWIRSSEGSHPLIKAFEQLQATEKVGEAVALITEYGLPWEAVPDALLNEPLVLGALIPSMGQTALIRNLSRFTRAGIDSSVLTSLVANRDRLVEGRVHPISVLLALNSYASGQSKGGKTWAPNSKILDALNDAFYLAFAAVEPANKRTMLALDVSGSMGMAAIPNSTLTSREASVAMSMVTLATEPWVSIMGFSTGFIPLAISARQRLDDAVRSVSNLPFQGTDCAQPMIYAAANQIPVDTFVVMTDSETWHGRIHPFQALRMYRERMGIDAKLIVSAFTATEFTIADPSDRGMLDTVGLDAALPGLISSFSRGDI